MNEQKQKDPRRVAAGRRGGLATARNQSKEWRVARAAKGGVALLQKYGKDYFAHQLAGKPVEA